MAYNGVVITTRHHMLSCHHFCWRYFAYADVLLRAAVYYHTLLVCCLSFCSRHIFFRHASRLLIDATLSDAAIITAFVSFLSIFFCLFCHLHIYIYIGLHTPTFSLSSVIIYYLFDYYYIIHNIYLLIVYFLRAML